jgi:hypothetical protein
MKFIIFSIGVPGTNECGVISGVGAPSLRALCTDTSTGVVCEISLVSITTYLIDFIIKSKVLLPQT